MSLPLDYDVLIVGAGLGGISQTQEVKSAGLSVKVVERAGDVGGTWYWNRYPGAMSDTESYLYRLTWDKQDLIDYPWPNHYLEQSEILNYTRYIVDKHDLRRHMQFNTEVVSAEWQGDHWFFTLDNGQNLRARYFITALGLLSTPTYPDIPGIDKFKGERYHTAEWNPNISVEGKRVGVIGCGSTGVQVVTALGPKAAHLYSFQRNPQYSVPSQNRPVEPEYRKWVNENWDKILQDMRQSSTCFGFQESKIPYASVPAEEREAVFESLWQQGNGFRFMFGGFSDVATDKEANDAACDFIKKKIREVVKDPVKARKLTPSEPYARRPLCDHGYYEQFNRETVDVVDLREESVVEITETGIQTKAGHYDLDILIFATGFDAVDGSFNLVEIRGNKGQTLKDQWANSDAPKSYLGLMVSGFPNMFMVLGPQGPFVNNPAGIEVQTALNVKLIQYTEEMRAKNGQAALEVNSETEDAWVDLCNASAQATLFPQTGSWIFGNNVKGKKPASRFFMNGMASYLEHVDGLISKGYPGLKTAA
ncbi:hypothetical protein MRS44_009660 [Fusarium solani]|uniref:uncharacterized protein n=1 Tax=Fusarium solani TaxID=169388 RepID=UPI0032C4A819|nr:hypothetical protein MRS44_009660 [Fusarium solani]